jgi:leader peptidase (prepilin peptidase)/N-methyltransferase
VGHHLDLRGVVVSALPVAAVSGALGAAIGATLTLVAQRDPVAVASGSSVTSAPLHLTPRVAFVAGATGVVFAAVTLRFGMSPELPAYLYLAVIGLACTVVDVDVRRLPDMIILPSYIVSALLLMPAGAAHGGWSAGPRAVGGMLALLVLFFALAMAYPNGVALSDVKLAGLVGMYLGWLSWNALFLTAVGSILIASVVGSFAIVTKHAPRNVAVPIGPCLVGAAILAMFLSTPISSWYASLITA